MERAIGLQDIVQTHDTTSPTEGARVVLVSPYGIENRGLRYISAVLRAQGFNPCVIFFKRWVNNQIREPTAREEEILAQHIKKLDPILVGFGFGAPYLKTVTRLTRLVREQTSALLLWGGVFPTVCPEDCIEHADAVCVGEGEYPTLDLCRALAEKKDITGIPNLWVRSHGTIVKNEPRP